MKKILCVIPYYVPAYSYGGPVKVAHDFNTALIQKGYDITVLTTDAHDAAGRNSVREEIIDGVLIIRHKNFSNKLAKFYNAYYPMGMKKRMRQNIKHFDLIHIHDILNFPAIWASIIAYKKSVPYFLHPHGVLSPVRVSSRFSFVKKLLLSLFHGMLNKASGIFALTKQEKKDISHHSTNKSIHILPNGIDLDEFSDITPVDLRPKYGLSEETIVFSYIGRIQYIKGLDRAFQLLAKYNKKNKDRRYLIIGPDEGEKGKLQNLANRLGISDNIIWYGMSTGKERYDLLASSDIFLFLSRSEGFPMTLLEALGCGLPLAISIGCNFPEILDGGVGELIDGNDIKTLEKIIKNKNNYINHCKGFLNRYKHNYILNKMIKLYAIKNS